MSAARLAAAKLIRRNRRRKPSPGGIAALACLLAPMVLGCVRLDWVAAPVEWLSSHGPLCAALAAVASAVQIARRRALKRAQFARSWLAALPVRASTARWEALAIETLPAIAAASLLAAASLSCALLLGFRHEGGSVAAFRAWAYLSTGIAVGVLGSYLIPQPKAVDLPPGSRYVPRARRGRSAAIRPSFSSLGQWPIRQMFARAQPKIVARATIPVMLAMPLGTMADAALVVLALSGIVGATSLLCSAVISTSRWARRWLAPLPVREHIIMRALLLPACTVIAAGGALETLLLLVFDVSVRIAVEVGAATSAIGCIIACVILL